MSKANKIGSREKEAQKSEDDRIERNRLRVANAELIIKFRELEQEKEARQCSDFVDDSVRTVIVEECYLIPRVANLRHCRKEFIDLVTDLNCDFARCPKIIYDVQLLLPNIPDFTAFCCVIPQSRLRLLRHL